MTKQELYDKHGIELLTHVASVEDALPYQPFGRKAEMIAKHGKVSVVKAQDALRDYQHFTEL